MNKLLDKKVVSPRVRLTNRSKVLIRLKVENNYRIHEIWINSKLKIRESEVEKYRVY